jgi:hypothetical protein
MQYSRREVLDNVLRLHKQSLFRKSREEDPFLSYTIALTIPQVNEPYTNNASRLFVNEGLREFSRNCSGRVFLFEMESIFNQLNQSNAKYWSPDKLHFSILGYDTIGKLLFEAITNIHIPDDNDPSSPLCRRNRKRMQGSSSDSNDVDDILKNAQLNYR